VKNEDLTLVLFIVMRVLLQMVLNTAATFMRCILKKIKIVLKVGIDMTGSMQRSGQQMA